MSQFPPVTDANVVGFPFRSKRLILVFSREVRRRPRNDRRLLPLRRGALALRRTTRRGDRVQLHVVPAPWRPVGVCRGRPWHRRARRDAAIPARRTDHRISFLRRLRLPRLLARRAREPARSPPHGGEPPSRRTGCGRPNPHRTLRRPRNLRALAARRPMRRRLLVLTSAPDRNGNWTRPCLTTQSQCPTTPPCAPRYGAHCTCWPIRRRTYSRTPSGWSSLRPKKAGASARTWARSRAPFAPRSWPARVSSRILLRKKPRAASINT